VSLQGNTQLEAIIVSPHLIVTVTGPPYFVVGYDKLLAWIGSVVLSHSRDLNSCYLPVITSFRVDSAPANSMLLNYKDYCNISFEVSQLESSKFPFLRPQNLSQDFIGETILILGFPTRRRPEGYPGLELSFDILLQSFQAERAVILEEQVFIKGRERMLKLIKHLDNVFLWNLLRPLANCCFCCVEDHCNGDVRKAYCPLDHHNLEAGRHILSKGADDAVLAEGVFCGALI
jgi:hypothetical protein